MNASEINDVFKIMDAFKIEDAVKIIDASNTAFKNRFCVSRHHMGVL